jgi:hypothetical protein
MPFLIKFLHDKSRNKPVFLLLPFGVSIVSRNIQFDSEIL